MSRNGFYFGTRNAMEWVPTPHVGMPRSGGRSQQDGRYANGGYYSSQGPLGARTYEIEWGYKSAEDIRHIRAVHQGLYDIGATVDESFEDRNVYFLDPFAMNTNILPTLWATPAVSVYGAPTLLTPLYRNARLQDPASNDWGYPLQATQLGSVGTEGTFPDSATLWIPVPEGYTFHFGFHGTFYGGWEFTVTPDGDTPDVIAPLGTSSSTLTNYTYTPTENSGVTLQIDASVWGYADIYGMIGQVLKNGEPAPTGKFYPGQGHSGCAFIDLTEDGYSTAFLPVNTFLTATLAEVGSWNP